MFCYFSDTRELAFSESYKWFKKFIELWFQVAHKKAEARIRKAVEIDQVRNTFVHFQNGNALPYKICSDLWFVACGDGNSHCDGCGDGNSYCDGCGDGDGDSYSDGCGDSDSYCEGSGEGDSYCDGCGDSNM